MRDEAHIVDPLPQGQWDKLSQVHGRIYLVEVHSVGFLSAAQHVPEEGWPGVPPIGLLIFVSCIIVNHIFWLPEPRGAFLAKRELLDKSAICLVMCDLLQGIPCSTHAIPHHIGECDLVFNAMILWLLPPEVLVLPFCLGS